MKKAALAVALGLVLLGATVFYRATRFTSRQMAVPSAAPLTFDTTAAAARLAGALTYRTISYQDSSRFDGAEFSRFQDYLLKSFPKLHARLKREVTNGYSLLYEWRGTDTTLKPMLLLAHQDVVPVEAGTESRWTEPPFAGRITDGEVWGRGAMDDKGNLMAGPGAVERLIPEGGAPRRPIYLAFGHDEELGGMDGATPDAPLRASRGVALADAADPGCGLASPHP